MRKPWFAIVWFVVWGGFQTFAVVAILAGTWEKPEAFPERAYESLVIPDLVFIPIYFAAAALLFMRHRLGTVLALVAGGGACYALVYLFALSNFRGVVNLLADSLFLLCTALAMSQAVRAGSRSAA